MATGEIEFTRTMQLLKQKEELIFKWKQAKLDAQNDNLLNPNQAVLRARSEHFDDKIKNTMREIETDIQSLGLSVVKE